jgi:hypothetical protein
MGPRTILGVQQPLIPKYISTDLEYLNAWSYRWLVKFNPNKTDIIIFSTRHLENNVLFDFNNISLDNFLTRKEASLLCHTFRVLI